MRACWRLRNDRAVSLLRSTGAGGIPVSSATVRRTASMFASSGGTASGPACSSSSSEVTPGGTGRPLARSPRRLPLTSPRSVLLISTHLPVVLTTAGVWSSALSNFPQLSHRGSCRATLIIFLTGRSSNEHLYDQACWVDVNGHGPAQGFMRVTWPRSLRSSMDPSAGRIGRRM